jgi:hypothetical protein
MKKLFSAITILLFLMGSAAMVSCQKDDPCEKAKNKCEECYEGTELNTCLTTVNACKILPPGLPRNDCCRDFYNDIKNCQ